MWKISYYWDNLDKKRVCLHISNSESNGFSSCGLEVEVSQLLWLVRILTDSHQLLLSDVGAVAATDIYWDFGPKLTERKDTSQARKNTVRFDRSVGGGHSIYRTINGFSLVQLHFNISTVWNLPWGWMVWVHERVRSSAAPMVFGGETCQAFSFSIWISGNNGWNTSHIFSCHLPLACWARKLNQLNQVNQVNHLP